MLLYFSITCTLSTVQRKIIVGSLLRGINLLSKWSAFYLSLYCPQSLNLLPEFPLHCGLPHHTLLTLPLALAQLGLQLPHMLHQPSSCLFSLPPPLPLTVQLLSQNLECYGDFKFKSKILLKHHIEQ